MRYFEKEEFEMNGEIVFDKMNQMFLLKLDELRHYVSQPLTLTSSYRSPEYNKKIGGAKGSKHMQGIAVDIACDNGTLRAKIVKTALNLGMSVGTAKSFVHVDDRAGGQVLFTYD